MVKKYEDFRNKLIEAINQSGLDIGAVTYILRDINREIEITYQRQLTIEIEKEKLEIEKKSEDSDEEDIVENVENTDSN